jgi:hypothetical protein
MAFTNKKIKMLNIPIIPRKQVESVEWNDDALEYDQKLSLLGDEHDEFLVINPEFAHLNFENLPIPIVDNECIIWNYNDKWVAKYFHKSWTPKMGYYPVNLSLIWERNPDISGKIHLIDDPSTKSVQDIFDLQYQMVWYIDPTYNVTENKVWIMKCQLSNFVSNGTKDMGYISPKVRIKYNPDIPKLDFDFNPKIPWYELRYEHVWYLDEKFNPTDERVWAIKLKLVDGNVKPVKDMGYISPKVRIKYNPDIPKLDFDFNPKIPWYELRYEHVWYLDEKFNPTDERVWAIKLKLVDGNVKPVKDMGYISPKIIYNVELPNIEYTIDDHIPYYDLSYEHVWMVNKKLTVNNEDIWAAKITPHEPKGTKIVGNVKFNLTAPLDVVFISYNEPNAETNWKKVLTKAPYAKRVDNITGIVAAHKQAASIVKTDMFYVVDGDAELVDDWDFNFQPNIFDRDCVHVWRSINPINGLKYGYGGVKLFPTNLVLAADENNTDMTTSLSKKFRLMTKISNTTSFNSDEFSSWRSAFRECAKLSSRIVNRQLSRETEKRLDIWCTVGEDKPFGKYTIAGAIAGRKFGEENVDNAKVLQLINNFEWIRTKFNEQ